jgi:flagellar hook assembly protein FlgD
MEEKCFLVQPCEILTQLMVSDNNNGAIITWYGRSYDHWGIFSQRVNKYGQLGRMTSVKLIQKRNNLSQYKLFQNYPNPFNSQTTIQYTLPENGKVKLTIFNLNGKEVKTLLNKFQPKGNYQTSWNGKNKNGSDVSSEIYLCQLNVNDKLKTKKLILAK